MDGIYEWLRNVAVFFLLMTAVLNVLPEAKYRKYVQFFLGLVMLAVLCKPVLALGNLSDSLSLTSALPPLNIVSSSIFISS